MNSDYKRAYTEVIEIIKYFPDEEYSKIPIKKINYYKENMDKDYNFQINPNMELEKQHISKEANDLTNYHCPRWEELPEIDLYVDQVVSILQKNLVIFSKDIDNPIITSSMINNYVKKEIIIPPIKKKYNKEHLAKLFVICICKRIMSISEIGDAIKSMQKMYSVEEGYNIFCEELENSIKHAFDYDNRKIDFPLEEKTRELATLKAITTAFANTILVDRLVLLRENKSKSKK